MKNIGVKMPTDEEKKDDSYTEYYKIKSNIEHMMAYLHQKQHAHPAAHQPAQPQYHQTPHPHHAPHHPPRQHPHQIQHPQHNYPHQKAK